MKNRKIVRSEIADIWFSLYYGKINTNARGVSERTVKNYSGEMRLTGFDKGILYHKEELHRLLDIAIENINNEQLLSTKNT